MKKPKQVVLVEWMDSHKEMAAWSDAEQVHPTAAPIQSAGFILRKDKEWLTLVGSLTDFGQVGEVTYIPRSTIKRIRKLKR